MKKHTFFLAVMSSFFAANAQNLSHSTFSLTVKTTSTDKSPRIFLAYQVEGRKTIDSADYQKDKHGYIFIGRVDRPLSATLISDPGGIGLSALIQKTKTSAKIDLLRFYLHPGAIELNIPDRLEHGKFTGSKVNADNQKLQRLLKPILDQ